MNPAGHLAAIDRRVPVILLWARPTDTFDSERYIMTTDNKALRDIASYAPYEFIEILTNSKTYGGGGIYNLYATVAADSEWMPYVFVHEFGHEFAGLADEYYTSDVSVGSPEKHIEPWEPNVTALLDPSMLKWKDLVIAGTPCAHAVGARRISRRMSTSFRRSGGRYARRTALKRR